MNIRPSVPTRDPSTHTPKKFVKETYMRRTMDDEAKHETIKNVHYPVVVYISKSTL